MSNTRIYKILILLSLLACAALLPAGQVIYAVSIIGMVLYVLSAGSAAWNRVSLDHIWAVSFALLVGLEGVLDADFIKEGIDAIYFDQAARYLVSINSIFLLVFNFILFEPRETKVASAPPYKKSFFWPVIVCLYLAYVVTFAPVAVDTLMYGRASLLDAKAEVSGVRDLITGGLIRNLGQILPITFAYYYLFVLVLPRSRALFRSLLTYLPILMIQLAMGVRSPLIMTALGLLAIYSSRFPRGERRLLKLGVMGTGLLLLSAILAQIRTWGLSRATEINISFDEGARSPFSEGVVDYFTRLVRYFDFNALRDGAEHMAVALFWVPRSLWPGKPEQLEHWFFAADRGGNTAGYSEAHSIAASFAATAYADFGFVGAAILWGLMGIVLAYLNRFVLRALYEQPGCPQAILAAIIIGLTFYAIRQINLVLFLGTALFILYWVIQNLIGVVPFRRDQKPPLIPEDFDHQSPAAGG